MKDFENAADAIKVAVDARKEAACLADGGEWINLSGVDEPWFDCLYRAVPE